MSSPANIASHLLEVLEASGKGDYIGEKISQKEHCLQAAHLASSSGADEETVIAALLHDIGQFLPTHEVRTLAHDVKNMDENVGRVGHEVIGAEYLARKGFSSKVSALVGAHVAAKRYLVATDPTYELSDASKASLKFQGGPMDEEEQRAFESDGLWREKCSLRKWDDGAKIEGLEVLDLDGYRDMIERHLLART